MVFGESLYGVGDDGADVETVVCEEIPDSMFYGFGKTADQVNLALSVTAAVAKCLQRPVIPVIQRFRDDSPTVFFSLVFHCERCERGKETVGVGLMIYGINQFGIRHLEGVVEQVPRLSRHPLGEVVVEQDAPHMVGGAVVAHHVSGACRLAFDSVAVIVAGVAAGAEDGYDAGSPSADGTACTEHVGADMNHACAESCRKHLLHPLSLLGVAAAGTVKI